MSDDNDGKKDGTGETLRAAFVIVLAGVLLGVAFNALGLASKPPRGLDWVKHERKLQSLEDMQGGGAAAPAGPEAGAPAAGARSAQTLTATGDAAEQQAAGTAVADTSAHKAAKTAAKAAKKPAATKAAGSKAGVATTAPPGTAPAPTSGGYPPTPPAAPAAAVDLPAIPDSKEPIEVQLATVKKFFDAKAAFIVDAREKEEFAAGHIVGARSLPFDDVVAKPELLAPLKGATRPVIIYCGGGDCELSKSLAWNMLDAGIHKVLVYTGGFSEWQKAGYPVEKGSE